MAHTHSGWIKRRQTGLAITLLTLLCAASIYSFFWQDRRVHQAHASSAFTTVDNQELRTQDGSHFSIRHIFHHTTKGQGDIHRRLDVASKSYARPCHMSIEEGEYVDLMNQRLGFTQNIRTTTHLADRSRHALEVYRTSGYTAQDQSGWISRPILSPNVTDRETLINLAEVASNAYIAVPHTEDWIDVGAKWNVSVDFGWQESGLRGHVWSDPHNKTVIIGYKGTSLAGLLYSATGTSSNDKANDNLLFSCCCARVSYAWTPVCGCYMTTNTCNATCLDAAVKDKEHYYSAALDIYYNVTALYPHANIWLVGHSLGGAIAALTGLTFGVPAVAFQSPGDLLASKRLHLPQPPGLSRNESLVWHFGHTSDPIFLGTCTGVGSACWYAGFAFETRCHTGLECVYDVVRDKGWRVSLGTHRIKEVIRDVLEAYDDVANCTASTEECEDCYAWEYVD